MPHWMHLVWALLLSIVYCVIMNNCSFFFRLEYLHWLATLGDLRSHVADEPGVTTRLQEASGSSAHAGKEYQIVLVRAGIVHRAAGFGAAGRSPCSLFLNNLIKIAVEVSYCIGLLWLFLVLFSFNPSVKGNSGDQSIWRFIILCL